MEGIMALSGTQLNLRRVIEPSDFGFYDKILADRMEDRRHNMARTF